MELAKDFFQLQLSFAERVAQITQSPVDEMLLAYTTFYLSFDLGRSFDPADPIWQAYLEGLRRTSDPAEWTFAFYQRRRTDFTADFYGCFYYSYIADEQTIRIHFINRESSQLSALSPARREVRVRELASMFAAVRVTLPEAKTVRGGSWLYHLDAYRRLFPPEYVQNPQPLDDEFAFMALWGQFLTRDGQLREPAAASFLDCVQEQTTLAGLKRCFAYQVLRPESAIDHFYRFYEPWRQAPNR
ncbi:MAG: hypothetical protein ACLQUY_02400 [Ktedonobacterales bacterium]